MKKLNLQGAFKHFIVATLSIMMVFSAIPMNAYAVDGNEGKVQFTKDPSNLIKNDVLLDGKALTMYCMQYNYAWPYNIGDGSAKDFETVSEFVDSDVYPDESDTHIKFTPEQLNMLQRALFAGYPHNGTGIFNELYQEFAAWGMEEYAYDMAETMTQGAIWYMLKEWGIKGNDRYSDDITKETEYPNNLAYEVYKYATETDQPYVKPAQGAEVTFSGDTTLVEEEDGFWRSGSISVVNPEGVDLLYKLTASDGLEIVGENLYTIEGKVDAGMTFRIQCEDPSTLGDDASIKAETLLTFPETPKYYYTNSYRYVASDPNDGWEKVNKGNLIYSMKPVQTMLTTGIGTMGIKGEVPVSVENKLDAGMIDNVSFVNTMNDDSDINGGDKDKDKNHGGVDTSDHAPLKPMIFLSITSLLGIIFMLFRRRIAK